MNVTFKHRVEYIALLGIDFCVKWMPEFIIYGISKFFYILLRYILKYRSNVIEINLSIAFPEKTAKERDQLKNKFYKHLSKFFLEFMKSPHRKPSFFEKNLTISGSELIQKYSGKPFIFVTGHYGDFANAISVISRHFKQPLHVIMKAQRNPLSSAHMANQRIQCQQIPHLSKGALRQIAKALKNNQAVGLLNDQRAGEDGLDATFFGASARTMSGLAFLKEKFDCPVIQGYCIRKKNGHFHFWIEELSFTKTENKQDNLLHITQTSNDHLEKSILAHPEQYLWSHKRFDINYKTFQAKN